MQIVSNLTKEDHRLRIVALHDIQKLLGNLPQVWYLREIYTPKMNFNQIRRSR